MNIGSRLRDAREAKGVSLEALSRTTRVKPRILEAIENNEAAAIPPRPYGRGFVSAYAAEVGLDPKNIVNDYFHQFAPPPPPVNVEAPEPVHTLGPYLPSIRTAYVVGGIVVAGLVLLGTRGFLNRNESAQRGAQPVPAPVAIGTGGSTAAPESVQNRSPVLTVRLEATDTVWVTASTDGQRTIYRTMRPGERETLSADRAIAIRVGDAAALRWRINDGPDNVMGARGAVRSVRLTPEDVRAAPSSPGAAQTGR
jgi:cytoskeletal protein RodZ